ncbi:hypothetical protein [Streptosporangium sp. NPDC048865]|uniref:hypothetical protein n=1 Tax=Streptosporangium sp. NPDC048865 TaxID=3155766 RepID=UPI00343802B3
MPRRPPAPRRTAHGGVVVLAGTVSPGVDLAWDAQDVVRGLLTVRGVHNYTPAHLARAASWSVRAVSRWPIAGLLSPVHPLAGLDLALAASARATGVRVGVAPG